MPEAKDDIIARGESRPTPLGRSIFCGLRLADPFLQRYILLATPLTSLGIVASAPTSLVVDGGLLTTLGLNMTATETAIWAMSVGSAVKHVFWALYIGKEPLSPGAAVGISLFNTINNSLNSLLFTVAASNPTYTSPYSLYAGIGLYATGILSETIAEVQRKTFKDKPENKGKVYKVGLFGAARHINYGGYTLWRSGYALACGGPVWGSLAAAFFSWHFANGAIPMLQEYGQRRYGEQWKSFEKDVPYKLLPGIY